MIRPLVTVVAVIGLIGATPPSKSTLQSLDVTEAAAIFKRICFDTLPDSQKFISALNAEAKNWALQKPDKKVLNNTRRWASEIGEIAYNLDDNLPTFIPSPGCHFTFHPNDGYSHEAMVLAISSATSAKLAASTGTPKEPQTRWEEPKGDGLLIRMFVSSNIKQKHGLFARLSVSVVRDARPER